uniref:Galectin n=1 Tax=Panagrellus redivivus TaxID=6233 RepID=A0A7E4ZTT8_PANRE
MYSRFVLLSLCLTFGIVQDFRKLTKGRNETVSFKGEELTIEVDNSMGVIDDLTICFGASPESSYQPCPLGFARFTLTIGANDKTRFTINRQGQFVTGSSWLKIRGSIKFNNYGTLNIMVVQLPDAKTIVTLPNAEIFVPKKSEDEKTVEKKSKGATIGTSRIKAKTNAGIQPPG